MKPSGKVDVQNIQRCARLLRALAEWGSIDQALDMLHNSRGKEIGVELTAGGIESDSGYEIVQQGGHVVVDRETGRRIAAAARQIIEDELRSLGVTL